MSDAYRHFAEIDALLARALELPANEQHAFLVEASPGDEEVRDASLRLLEAAQQEGSALERRTAFAALGARAAALAREEAVAGEIGALEVGSRFGSYEVLAQIGSGGMGEVYRARDTRLGREVALKVLPTELAEDPDRVARLELEARLLATLNHPHINTIHELEEAEGHKALVLELVGGRTLAEQLAEGPLRVPEALAAAKQIAEALEAAHGKGVLHRDLKPSNIKITADGQVKVLDFGLAKSFGPQAPDEDQVLPAEQTQITRTGHILGTAPYMSPEQWRGKSADRRSDLWAFGCILYEMFAGVRAFAGETSAETAAAVLEREPDWSALPANTPRQVRELLRRCLEKEPDQRLSEARGARHQIERALAGRGSGVSSRRAMALLAALVALVALALILGYRGSLRRASPGEAIDSIAVLPFENTSDDPEGEYLSDGVTESLINSLSKLPNLRVAPRGIVFGYKGRSIDPEIVAAELEVRALVTGRVGERDGTLILGVELMDVAALAQLWGQQYTRPAVDLLAVQEDLVGRIVEELRLELTPEERRRALDPATENPQAYRLYLKTNYHIVKLTPEGLDKGLEYAQQAVELDPGFALAHVALSQAHMTRAFVGLESWDAGRDKSRAAARRALDLDGSLSEAHVELGFVRHHFDWDWAGALQAFERALELDPNNADAHQGRSEALASLGRVEEALVSAERAVQANPFSANFRHWFAMCNLYTRRYPEALDLAREVLKLEPNHIFAQHVLPQMLFLSGREQEAIATYRKYLAETGGDAETSLILASLYARGGQEKEARTILSRVNFDHFDQLGPFAQAALAQTLGSLGEMDQAFDLLEHMVEKRSRSLLWMISSPSWDPLRGQPRFENLLRRMGLSRT